jgi:hypothetical protein
MPPDPILALLSIVGLFLYLAVGAVLATVAMRLMDPQKPKRKREGPSIQAIAGNGGNPTAWIGWWAMALIWPAMIALVIPAACCFALFAGPVLIARNIGKYTAGALVKETESD